MSWLLQYIIDLTCKRGSVGQSKGLSIPRSSVRFRLKPDNSNSHEFELHRPSNKGTKLLLKVIKAIIIIRVDSPSCTSKHEVLNHTNCDCSTDQRRSSLQKHRVSIFCIVIPQSIVHGVLPRAHINDCGWHDPAQPGAIFSFVVC